MNRPFDVAKYRREYDDDFGSRLGPIYVRGDALFDIESAITRMASGRGKAIAYHVRMFNGQKVIVRPLSPLRRQMREAATRLALAFCNGEPQRMKPTRGTGTMSAETAMALNLRAREVLKTACDHLGPRGYGE